LTKIRTFKDIVQQSFFDEIENRVSLYVEQNFSVMDFNSNKENSVDEAHVQEHELYRIVAYDSIGDTLTFDAIVVADIDIYRVTRHNDFQDTARKWFRVSCSVDVVDGFSNFKILNVDDEYDHNVNDHSDRLDDNLVPVISTADIERYAEDILRNVYPEALDSPHEGQCREIRRTA